jgi:glutaminyl-peptide cyclotransferase
MIRKMQAYRNLLLFIIFMLLSSMGGCSEGESGRDTGGIRGDARRQNDPSPLSGKILEPSDGALFTRGENIDIVVSVDDSKGPVSSVSMIVDGTEVPFSGQLPGTLSWDTSGQPVGTRRLNIIVGFGDGSRETWPLRVTLRSDIPPAIYGYRIVNSFPHDIRAFTQGLIYHDGYLYESTGRYGESTLRRVRLETGEVLRSLSLDRNLFGEGLAMHDGRLYQLTWKSQVGFIYDPESFRTVGRIHYTTEGWGLTSNGEHLIKTDGSHNLYFMDPRYFTEVKRVEVFDNNGRVDQLNELEFIDGLVYANVLDSDHIVIIEPETGRVNGRIDLTGLLEQRYHHPNLDVLNGIAYDNENGRLFVTGKNWPRLFEIQKVAR